MFPSENDAAPGRPSRAEQHSCCAHLAASIPSSSTSVAASTPAWSSDMPPVYGHRSDSASPSSSPQDDPIVVKYMDASDAASDSNAAAATGASYVDSEEDVLLGTEVVPRSCRDPPTARPSTLIADSSRILSLVAESLPPSMDTSTGMTASSIPSRITLVDGSSRTPGLGEELILRRSTLIVDSPRIGSLPHGFGEDVIAHSGLPISCVVLTCGESLRIVSLPLGFGEDVVAHNSRVLRDPECAPHFTKMRAKSLPCQLTCAAKSYFECLHDCLLGSRVCRLRWFEESTRLVASVIVKHCIL
jgi:hypothetical protein